MKKFTSNLMTWLGALVAFVSVSPAHAQVTSAADLYGTYEFTATMEITTDGQEYKDLFSDKCDVKITAGNPYDLSIVGLGGSKIEEGQTGNYSNGTIDIKNPNGSTYYYWGNSIILGSPEGASPFDGSGWSVTHTVDVNTKEITLQDFTAITVDGSWNTDKILAKFTNCKLTFKEGEVVEINDISGDYHFTAGSGAYDVNLDSEVPTEFDMTVTATDETFTAYNVTIDYGTGYTPVTLPATFNGYTLNVTVENAFLNDTLAIADYNIPSNLSTTIEFNYASETTLTLFRAICISKKVVTDGTTTYAYDQHYLAGFAKKAADEGDAVDFSGTYHVKSTNYTWMVDGYEYPVEFDMVIEAVADYNTGVESYYVKQFVNGNIYNNTWGAYPCTVEGNVLKLPVGEGVKVARTYANDDYTIMVYDVLFDGLGEDKTPISLTLNDDGTWTMGDFSLYSDTIEYAPDWSSTTKLGGMTAFYGNLEVTKVVQEPLDFQGTYWFTADVETNVSDVTYPKTDVKMVIEEVFDYEGNSLGLFVKDFVNGDIYSSTYAAYPCVVEGNVLKIPTGKADQGAKIEQVWHDENWLTMVYDVLYDTEKEYITLTANEDGTFSMDDFSFYRRTETWDANYTTKETVLGDWSVRYKNIMIKKQGEAIENVEIANPTVKVAVENGTIKVVGAAVPVQVYSLSGACVFNGVANQISGLNKGMYIVKCGNATVKVIL